MFKKIIFLFIAITFFVSATEAQKAFNNGDAALNIGVGLGSPYNFAPGVTAFPSINTSFEYGIIEIPKIGVISAGVFAAFKHSYDKYDTYKDTYNYTTIATRGAFHLGFLKTSKFDVYGGVIIGITHKVYVDELSTQNSYTRNDLVLDVFAGGRIMFSKKFGVFAELGYGISFLKAGVTLKF